MKVQELIQNVYHCSSADGGTQVLYIIPSAVEDHYIFYYEGKIHRHHFRVAKLVGESHGCERGLAAVGVPAVRRTNIETGARTESAASITAAVSVPFLEMRALAPPELSLRLGTCPDRAGDSMGPSVNGGLSLECHWSHCSHLP